MKGVCQSCGATASLEWFLQKPLERQVLVTVLDLPKPVQANIIQYLSLFRPTSTRSLTAAKALRLVEEIKAIVNSGYVTRKGRPDRDCAPSVWGMAMETMLANRDRLELPMESHVYLRKVAYDLADKENSGRERQVVQRERTGSQYDVTNCDNQRKFDGVNPDVLARLSPEVRKLYEE